MKVFAQLKGGDKLQYDANSGLFKIVTSNLLRTLKNVGQDDPQSVTSDTNFQQPVVEVFYMALSQGADTDSAYAGLKNLEQTYRDDYQKLSALHNVLKQIGDSSYNKPPDLEFFEKWRAADPTDPNIFGEQDRKFLKEKVFAVPDIMNYPTRERRNEDMPTKLADKIYRQYNGVLDAQPPVPVELFGIPQNISAPPAPLGQDWLEGLPQDEKWPFLQNQHEPSPLLLEQPDQKPKKPKRIMLKGNANTILADPSKATDFIYYQFAKAEGQLWRLYVNCQANSAAGILRTILDKSDNYSVSSFKVSGPGAFHARSDKIVVYVRGRDNAKKLADLLHETHREAAAFQNTLPAFVIGLHPGIGIGTEPEHEALGMAGEYKPVNGEVVWVEQHSFGSIRAKLIALAVLYFVENKKVLGKYEKRSEQAFLKCAAVAFQGFAAALKGIKRPL